jgi:raffinose/stachyose/melibiose transport system substrate-binding protein
MVLFCKEVDMRSFRFLSVAAIFAIILCIPAFAADNVTLQFMHFYAPAPAGSSPAPEVPVFDNTLKQWLAEHPDVTVEQDALSHDEFETKFRALAAANELPDVFMINGNVITSLGVNAGQLYDLAPALKADPAWYNMQIPGSWDEWVRGDHTYAISMQMIITHVIYYNQDMFKKVGITGTNKLWGGNFPETWAGFKDAIVKLKKAGYTPIALGDKGKWLFRDSVFGTLSNRITGTDWNYKARLHQAKWNDPDFVKALETLKELMDLGAFNADATSIDNMQQRTLYYNKKAGMFIEGNWAAPAIDQDAPKDVAASTKMALFPAIPGGKGKATDTVTIAGWAWAINAKLKGQTDKLNAAISLLKALSDAEYGRMRMEAGQMPGQKVDKFDASKLSPLSAAFFSMIPKTTGLPHLTIPFPPSVDDVLGTGLQNMIAGKATPKQVADKVQADWDKYK